MDTLSDVSLLIKTFEREEALTRLLRSIREQGYTDCPVLVADDSKQPYKESVMEKFGSLVDEYVVLPFNSGVSRGRNVLLRRVDTKYFILHDDDFVYQNKTDIKYMKTEISKRESDIIGFPYEQPKYIPPKFIRSTLGSNKYYSLENILNIYSKEIKIWSGVFEKENKKIILKRAKTNKKEPSKCDFVSNFFIARTNPIKEKLGGWCDELKSFGEHWEFFYRSKIKGIDVEGIKKCPILHIPISNKEYKKYRNKNENKYLKRSLEMHSFEEMVRGGRSFKITPSGKAYWT